MDCNWFWRDQHINYQPPIFILAHPLSEDSWNEVARKFLLAQFSKLSEKLQVNIIWTTQEPLFWHRSLQKRYQQNFLSAPLAQPWDRLHTAMGTDEVGREEFYWIP